MEPAVKVQFRCAALHNPGRWPYVARCVLGRVHKGKHRDQYGNEWLEEKAE